MLEVPDVDLRAPDSFFAPHGNDSGPVLEYQIRLAITLTKPAALHFGVARMIAVRPHSHRDMRDPVGVEPLAGFALDKVATAGPDFDMRSGVSECHERVDDWPDGRIEHAGAIEFFPSARLLRAVIRGDQVNAMHAARQRAVEVENYEDGLSPIRAARSSTPNPGTSRLHSSKQRFAK